MNWFLKNLCDGKDAATWLMLPPESSLAFVLADKGFDVWLANTRGTKFSQGHSSLGPDDPVIAHFFSFQSYMFFAICDIKLLFRDSGTGHGMNWWLLIFLPHSSMFMIILGRRCTMLDTHWLVLALFDFPLF